MKNSGNMVQAAIEVARQIRLEQGKDWWTIGAREMSSAANPVLIVEYMTASLPLIAHGFGGIKVLKRWLGILNRRMGSERRKGDHRQYRPDECS